MNKQLDDILEERFCAWHPTIWTARRRLHGLFGRRIELGINDGVRNNVPVKAILLDVLHSPERGLVLKVKDAKPLRDNSYTSSEELPRVGEIPLFLVTSLPTEMDFLKKRKEEWILNTEVMCCLSCNKKVYGRFCSLCGKKTNSRMPEAFYIRQKLLRESNCEGRVSTHSCGCSVHSSEVFCCKCGLTLT